MQESPVQPFMRRPKRLLLVVALTLFCLGPAESVRADSNVCQKPLHSTGLVEPVEHSHSGPVHSAKEPGTDWVLAALLIGAAGVLLLLGKIRGQRNSTKNTAPETGEVENSAPRGHLQDGFQTRT
jgi:hypothetical protein